MLESLPKLPSSHLHTSKFAEVNMESLFVIFLYDSRTNLLCTPYAPLIFGIHVELSFKTFPTVPFLRPLLC